MSAAVTVSELTNYEHCVTWTDSYRYTVSMYGESHLGRLVKKKKKKKHNNNKFVLAHK